MLTRKDILEFNDLITEEVGIPEWGGSVFVRTMTTRERDAFECDSVSEQGGDVQTNMDNLRAKLCVRCVVDEEGVRVFGDKDADLLGEKSAAAVDRIFDVAQKLNGMSPDDIEELAKNSGTGQPEDSALS